MWNKIKLILKSLKQYKKYAIITPIFMVLEVLFESALPFVMSVFLDLSIQIHDISQFTDVISHPRLPFDVSLLGLIIAMIIMACLSLAAGILGGKFAAKASVGLATNLRSDLYKKIQSFSFANIDKFSTSSLVTRMTTDIANVQQAFQMCIRIVVRAPLMMIFSATMAFISGGSVAWLFIILIPVLGIGLFFIIKKAMTIFMKVFKRYDALNESVQENVTGIRVVKSYVREDYEKQKFSNASNNMKNDFVKAEKIVALNNPLMNTTIHLSNILVVGIASFLIATYSSVVSADGNVTIVNDVLSIGQMSSLLTYGIQILTSIMMISMIMVMFTMSLEAVRRIGEVLEEEPTIKNPENPIYELSDGSVDFNHVNFSYKSDAEKNTLSDIDIHIKSGQFVGILGSTGAGKTSIVNLISRLYDVGEGSVLVSGKDVREYDLKTLRDNVAVVLQKNVLFSGTIADNMRWGDLFASDEEIKKACQIAQADEFVEQFPNKYDTKIEQGGSNVSGGQKQRLCIARAILKKPKILILDDSTSAVDTKTDRLIRKHLKEDIPETTKIVIAQRISSIEDADQIIILDNGKINAIGTHQELIKNNEIYKEVYNTQNKVGGTK
jgi:ATP-binding cassette, subfamily B, multidrug efflux pump